MEHVGIFSADYRDGRVSIGGKTFPAGSFAVHLLNQYYENDTAARISVFVQYNWQVAQQLTDGYLIEDDYLKAGEEVQHILETLPALQPFSMLDTDTERNRIAALFTLANAARLTEYLRRRGAMADYEGLTVGVMPKEYDKSVFQEADALLSEVVATLRFYSRISEDMRKAFSALAAFVARVDDAERLDEAHLLPIAMAVFDQAAFPVKTEYIPARKNKASKCETVARRLFFESYYSFILTDFFEGLHYGHYPRQCEICKRYFLMQSAARQKYCSGNAPFLLKGKPISCRKYAARTKRKALADANPVTRLYKSRCSALRTEKGRGTVTPEFAERGLKLAKEYWQRAKGDSDYANGQYAVDMSREKFYPTVDRLLK